MAQLDSSGIRLFTLTLILGTVSAAENDLNYVIASSTVAILLFFLCFVMGCVFYNCSDIYRSFGYERIPRLELKRREMVRKMASQASSQQYLTAVPVEKDTVSWIQRWQDQEGLEERQDAVMQLGPEGPEPEYRIETTLVDNDPLDLGPYRSSVGNGSVPDGLYATIDKSSIKQGNGTLQSNARDSTDVL